MDFRIFTRLLSVKQAYSPIPPHGFLASSPHAQPYMWGVQVRKICANYASEYFKLE